MGLFSSDLSERECFLEYNENIYIVKQVDFDGLENSVAQALSVKILGYVGNKNRATIIAKNLLEESIKYKSWESTKYREDNIYPKFQIEEIKFLEG